MHEEVRTLHVDHTLQADNRPVLLQKHTHYGNPLASNPDTASTHDVRQYSAHVQLKAVE